MDGKKLFEPIPEKERKPLSPFKKASAPKQPETWISKSWQKESQISRDQKQAQEKIPR